MDDKLLGYLLNGLDDAEQRQVEAYLVERPEARARLNLLRQALEPLACDRADPAPPPDLVRRTLGRVAEHICTDDLPRAPAPSPTAVLALRTWWRRADVLVAACLAVLALGISLPLLARLRTPHATLACQNNLRQFYTALATYRDQHGGFPDLSREAPRNVAGMVVPVLAEAGVLPADFSVRCPAVGPHLGSQVRAADLRAMPAAEFDAHAPGLALAYAYSLGYRDETGDYRAPWQSPLAESAWPILADRPPGDAAPGNSANHGGAGQNVLFLDGHVQFASARSLVGDDIFLNRANRVAAGLGPRDAVLGTSAARP